MSCARHGKARRECITCRKCHGAGISIQEQAALWFSNQQVHSDSLSGSACLCFSSNSLSSCHVPPIIFSLFSSCSALLLSISFFLSHLFLLVLLLNFANFYYYFPSSVCPFFHGYIFILLLPFPCFLIYLSSPSVFYSFIFLPVSLLFQLYASLSLSSSV
jgi:hypothetical protein